MRPWLSPVARWVLLAVALCPAAAAQTGVQIDSASIVARPVPVAALDGFRADPDYAYDRVSPPAVSIWDVVWRWIAEHIFDPFYENTTPRSRDVMLYVLLGAALLFALYKLFGADRQGGFRRRDAIGSGFGHALRADDIERLDLDALAEQAAREGRFRDAVRLRYLWTLQALAAAGRIRWTVEKTNREYAAELCGSGLEAPFGTVTALFDRAWYGSLPVDAAGFAEAEAAFRRFHEALPAEAGA